MGKQQRHHMQEADHLNLRSIVLRARRSPCQFVALLRLSAANRKLSKSTALRSKLTSTTIVKVLPTPSTKPISAAVIGHSTAAG